MAKRRKNRRNATKRFDESFDVVHPRAAGIDIGSRSHFIAVPPTLTDEPVREFSALTPGLQQLVAWLIGLGITTVAMESTGVYWVPLYEMLESAGIDVPATRAAPCSRCSLRVLNAKSEARAIGFGPLRYVAAWTGSASS